MRILATFMTTIFCLSFLSLSGDVCPEDAAVMTSAYQNAHPGATQVVAATSDKSSSDPATHPVHVCHCGHTFQLLSGQTTNVLKHTSLDPSIRRWPRFDDECASRSLSPLLRPPIYS